MMRRAGIYASVALNIAGLAALVNVIEGRGGIAYLKSRLGHDATSIVDPSYEIRQSMFEAAAGALKVRPIVFLGDSLTAGCEWRELFGNDALILNRGIGGDTSAGVLRRASSVAALHPLAVFLMIGANDPQTLGYGPEQTVANWKSIIATIRKTSPDTAIYMQSLLPSVAPKFVSWSASVNDQLRTLADGRSVVFLDLRPAFLRDGVIKKELTADGLHLNGAGYMLWKQQIDPVVEELIRRQNP